MPVGAIVGAVQDLKPTLICLSVTQMSREWDWVDELRELTESSCQGCHIILGGRAIREQAFSPSPFDAICSTSKELLEFLQGLGDHGAPSNYQI